MADIKPLVEERARMVAEMTRLKHVVEGIDMALEIMADGDAQAALAVPRSGVKRYVLQLLEEVGQEGLNAAIAVDMAAGRGILLQRGTVSSLLSRFVHDGAVAHDGALYRLVTR